MSLNVFNSVSELVRKLNIYFSNNNLDIVFKDFSISSSGQCHLINFDGDIIRFEFKDCMFTQWNIENVSIPTAESLLLL